MISENSQLAQGKISLCGCFTKHVWKKPNHTCLVISTRMCNKTHLCGQSHTAGPCVVCGFYHTRVGKTKHVWKQPHILTLSKFHMGSSILQKSPPHPLPHHTQTHISPPICIQIQQHSRLTFSFNIAAFPPTILLSQTSVSFPNLSQTLEVTALQPQKVFGKNLTCVVFTKYLRLFQTFGKNHTCV